MSDPVAFTRDDILRLFGLLNVELARQHTVGEVRHGYDGNERSSTDVLHAENTRFRAR